MLVQLTSIDINTYFKNMKRAVRFVLKTDKLLSKIIST